jgi:hypothetical protein
VNLKERKITVKQATENNHSPCRQFCQILRWAKRNQIKRSQYLMKTSENIAGMHMENTKMLSGNAITSFRAARHSTLSFGIQKLKQQIRKTEKRKN